MMSQKYGYFHWKSQRVVFPNLCFKNFKFLQTFHEFLNDEGTNALDFLTLLLKSDQYSKSLGPPFLIILLFLDFSLFQGLIQIDF